MRSPKTQPRLTHADVSLQVREDGGVRLAVVADTHSHPHPQTPHLLTAERPDAILHAGDIGDLSVLDDLGQIAKVVAIRGNIDSHAAELPDTIALDLLSGERRVMRLFLMHIAVYGPKLRADAARLAKEHAADLVICGHSHVPFAGRDRGFVVFNPGSIGPRRFGLPIVYGMLELSANRLHVKHVDCETGKDWMPPGG